MNAETEIKKTWYDRYYKILVFLSLSLTFIALAYVVLFYFKTGDIMYKDVSLTGGTTITVYSDIGIEKVREILPSDIVIRQLSDLQTGKQLAFSVETTKKPEEIIPALESFLGYNLTEQNSSIEFTGPSLSASFYKELRIALILAFILMALVVFVIFKTFIPSFAVIQAAFTDIVVTLAIADISGFKISSAGIAAFLMLIGYSVDTDIMLTNRVLRKQELNLNSRIKSALNTGLAMTLTSLAAVFLVFLIVRGISSTLSEIFLILSLGLTVDLISTWLGNAGILKWYCTKKGIK